MNVFIFFPIFSDKLFQYLAGKNFLNARYYGIRENFFCLTQPTVVTSIDCKQGFIHASEICDPSSGKISDR
jgi:hypothetical protein